MAKLRKKHLFTLDAEDAKAYGVGIAHTVGHNRTLELQVLNDALRQTGRLHGIVVFNRTVIPARGVDVVTLTHHGWRTVTTRSAMRDFLEASGVPVNVSFAKDEFTAWNYRNGSKYTGDDAIIIDMNENRLEEAE